jgi:heat shock protein HslJ
MRKSNAMSASLLIFAACLTLLASCGESGAPTKAQQAEAKRAKDAELMALSYPKSTGIQPKTMEITFDGASNRTSMMLRLVDLRVSGDGARQVSSSVLHLTSSHKGRVRPSDDPEGSVDGSLVAQSSTSGVLAYSGAPGTVTADGQTTPLKGASGKNEYSSTKTATGNEEIVGFRFPTKDLITASKASNLSMAFGTIKVELTGQQLEDLREFAARLNPKP